MEFRYIKTYCGPVKLVICDLAGTTVDYGSCAPAGAFIELFRRYDVEITMAQARAPMGLHKKDHIRTIATMSDVKAKWVEAHGTPWTESDIEAMYQEFIPIQIECLPRYGKLVPGTVETVEQFHIRGIKVATTTGYNNEMMDIVLKGAAEQGFVPDVALCASQVSMGRPAPWMIYRCMEELGIYPPQATVKIGDTLPDIEAGLNAGVWTIGVAKTGNMLGLNEEEIGTLQPEELGLRLADAYWKMYQTGAHYVVDGITDCVNVIDEIMNRLISV